MLIENILFLKKNYPGIREDLLEFEEQINDNLVKVVDSKSGNPTLEILSTNGVVYLHSKYDPKKEAQRFIEQYKESIQEYDHVFFYGIGLGYHVEAFMERYPNITFTMYEPSMEVLSNYLSIKRLEKLPTALLNAIYVEKFENDYLAFINKLTSTINKNLLFIPLPSYERIYKKKYQKFINQFKTTIKNSRAGLHTNISYQKRWTINTIKNFPKTFETPNILKDVNNKYFINKPGIIVSAGPSLTGEIKNLKYIKEHGLAYIFSVGSSINTLIEYGIYPDAACTFDPSVKNQKVFEKLKEKHIVDIPLIFGSSVGYETLENYSGLMFHMLTNQDTISPRLLSGLEDDQILFDAPSIAIVTYQLMVKLGFSRIILVGQNLAFQNSKRYAEGIDYGDNSNTITNREKEKVIIIKDVYGNDVETSESFLRMKTDLEIYIQNHKNIETINTTKGGANINGTTFMKLDDVINNKLITRSIVNSSWKEAESNYDLDFTLDKLKIINKSRIALKQQLDDLVNLFSQLNYIKKENPDKIEKNLNKIDKNFKNIKNNDFFLLFISPMLRVQLEILGKNSAEIKYENDIVKKIKMINKHHGNLTKDIVEHYKFITTYFNELKDL
ncbi:motility associated factor glycosyltransferase family protein [Paraliobacillus sediminis]|uniref:motility associated factor glycosyltransferase family protein n=1 Tax=Paraliobacillus sediminis TaxID=1885916 RepID=UPI0013C2F64B|nr:6-hydroxymethylpterin diphosphokinase MptE-like protein [Paraliobacillus sediminis]